MEGLSVTGGKNKTDIRVKTQVWYYRRWMFLTSERFSFRLSVYYRLPEGERFGHIFSTESQLKISFASPTFWFSLCLISIECSRDQLINPYSSFQSMATSIKGFTKQLRNTNKTFPHTWTNAGETAAPTMSCYFKPHNTNENSCSKNSNSIVRAKQTPRKTEQSERTDIQR